MTSLNKDEAGFSTDAEENQQSEGECKKLNSKDPDENEKNRKLNRGKRKTALRNPRSESFAKEICSKTLVQTSFSNHSESIFNQDIGCRLMVFEPPKMHVLRPHSHRRHFTHHLRDHFTSAEVLRSPDKQHKKEKHKEIIPTLDSCEYKDTNFLTEGSPPRTPVRRPHLKAKVLSGGDEIAEQRKETPNRRKMPVHLAASCWKEPPDRSTGQVQWRSSPESNSGSDNGRTFNYLQKYKNESIVGPSQRINPNITYFYNRGSVIRSSQEQLSAEHSRTRDRRWNEPEASQNRYNTVPVSKKSKTFSSKTLSSRAKETSRSSQSSSVFSSCIPSITSLRCGNSSKNFPKSSKCQGCLKKSELLKNVCTQTEMAPKNMTSPFFSQSCALDEDIPDKSSPNIDMSLYALLPRADLSESNSFSTEDTSSMTFDEDDVINYNSSIGDLTSKNKKAKRSILIDVKEVQSKIRYLKKEAHTALTEVKFSDKSSFHDLVEEIFCELKEVVDAIVELYDDFDTDEKEEQSQFNELKKQIQQYKRTCRILEYELIKSDAKLAEQAETDDLQEELLTSKQLATVLYSELQHYDATMQKINTENDVLREKFTSCEVQRSLLEQEVVTLRNTVDQMSLHASSVPTNERRCVEAVESGDTVPDLRRQIQFQEEERLAILKKLIETDKEKEKLEEQLQLYLKRYGEISSFENGSVDKEEWSKNDLKARVRMAEDQAALLGRKIVKLLHEAEKNIKENEAAAFTTKSETFSHVTLSDLQFLEDEVETLKITLEEVERENCELRDELRQLQKKSNSTEKYVQTHPCNRISHGSVLSPTISDKVAAWQVSDPCTPMTNNTDFTTAGVDSVLILTSIDAGTQTYDPPIAPPTSGINVGTERKVSLTLSKDLLERVDRVRGTDVESLVSQLKNLAIATRSLVDDSPSRASSLTEARHSSMTSEARFSPPQTPDYVPETLYLALDKRFHFSSETRSATEGMLPHFQKFDILLLSLMAYIIVTSLPITSLLKLGILLIFFFLL